MTRRQIAFLGLLCAGLAALGIDRAFFEGGPRRAQAAVSGAGAVVGAATADEAPSAAAAEPVEPVEPLDRLAERLRALPPPASDVTDAFATSLAWRATSHAAAAPVEDTTGVDFIVKHKLTAVLCTGGGGGSAIVDGVTLRRGQRLDGFVLVEVFPRRVRFAHGSTAAELALAP
jgi:hypothetical protein